MNVCVVDASVAVKWFVPEIYSTDATRLLRKNIALLVPDLIFAEVGNVLWKRWRRKEMDASEITGILSDFRRLPMRRVSAYDLSDTAWQVAAQTERTFYDSLYVALAIQAEAPLVTADRRLFNDLASGPMRTRLLWVGDVPMRT